MIRQRIYTNDQIFPNYTHYVFYASNSFLYLTPLSEEVESVFAINFTGTWMASLRVKPQYSAVMLMYLYIFREWYICIFTSKHD